jgi:formate dehydrogenase maturation protein FdhE
VELKGDFPPNVLSSGLSSYIKGFNEILFSDAELFSLERRLKQFQEGNTISSKQHIDNLEARYSSETKCPKCGGKLVRKIAKRGASVGTEFLGCSNFPSCKYIKK